MTRSACLVLWMGILAAADLLPSPPAEQQGIFAELAAKTYLAKQAVDAEGNLVWVGFNHMEIYAKENPGAPGLGDDDLASIRHFHRLRGITLQGQPLSDAGYAILADFPELEVAGLPNPAKSPGRPKDQPQLCSRDFIRPLDACRKLKVLDLTHTFALDRIPIDELQGFPELRFLSVDVGASDARLLAFLARCPRITNLRLHRTTLTNADLEKLLALLPELQSIEIKPDDRLPIDRRINHRALAALAEHPTLEVCAWSHRGALPMPWDDGLEHVLQARRWRGFSIPLEGEGAPQAEDLERLRREFPELQINPPKIKSLRRIPFPEWDWEFGPR